MDDMKFINKEKTIKLVTAKDEYLFIKPDDERECTKEAFTAVFKWLANNIAEGANGVEIRLPGEPYVLRMLREEKKNEKSK